MNNDFQDLNVNVIDPLNNKVFNANLIKKNAGFKITNIHETIDENTNLFLTPGWIDIHTHIYDGVTQLSIPPNEIGMKHGVHLLADAGSAGEATIDGFKKYIVPQSNIKIKAWLNISSIGLVHLREGSDVNYLNPERTVEAVNKNRDLICGIKVRSSGDIVGAAGLQSLKLAKLVARETKLPLMVHIGETPPLIEDILELLDEGDVITHCYHGKLGKPWKDDGTPIKALQQAMERGVKLDVGHGAASFSLDVCRKAVSKEYIPTTISTDLHIRNIKGPVFDLATTMNKLLACGMDLQEVIKSVTLYASNILQIEDWCHLDLENIDNITLFRLQDHIGKGGYKDTSGKILVPDKEINPIGVITDGTYFKIK